MADISFWVLMFSVEFIYLCIHSFIFRDQGRGPVQINHHNHSLHHRVCLQDIHHHILAMEVQCNQVLWDMFLHQHSRVS